jgi:GTP-binding protein
VDRPDARVDEVVNEVFDLFLSLEATDEQADFPILYASAKEGWVTEDLAHRAITMVPLLQKLADTVPTPTGDRQKPFQFLASIIEANPYLGRILTGRIISGTARENMPIHAIDQQGNIIEQGRLTKIMRTQGVKQFPITEAGAGEIISIAGLAEATVGSTVSDLAIKDVVPSIPIDPPTLAMTFSVNDSPYAGQDGDKLTSRNIRDRLFREAEGNISISVKESAGGDAFEVAGRGELQLGVLIENMRREGFELSISRPRVLYQKDAAGTLLEPMEEVKVDVDEAYVGVVVETIGLRKGEMRDMAPIAGGKARLTFECPSRGLIGYRSQFLTDTRGTGIMHRSFSGYGPYKRDIPGRINGVLISNDQGKAVAYAIWNLEDRGAFFINPGDDVYQGMIIGEHNRGNDLEVNPLKAKKLTNVRASGKDEGIRLTPPLKLTLEDALSYIQDDELVEVTPKKIRLRKRYLDPNERKRNEKKKDV